MTPTLRESPSRLRRGWRGLNSWSHYIHNQKAESDEHWCPVHLPFFTQPGAQPRSNPHLGQIFTPQPKPESPSMTHSEVCLLGNSKFINTDHHTRKIAFFCKCYSFAAFILKNIYLNAFLFWFFGTGFTL